MNKYCQSCGMPLTKENAGSEKDFSRSTKYCLLCYSQGEFIDPNITKQAIIERGILGVSMNQDMSKFKKWLIIKTYPKMVSRLERWK